MSDRIKKIKVKKADGSMTDYIPIGVDAENVDFDNGYKLDNIVGSINPDESGSIAAQLSKSIKYYDCVTDMKADTTLNGGGAARTLGYYEPGDGGGAIYKVVETSSDLTVALNNGLYAELNIDKEINVKQLGAYGDGEHDDTNIIQFAINSGWNVFIPKGVYNISSTISIPNNPITIYGDGSITTGISFGTILKWKTMNSALFSLSGYCSKIIKNFTIINDSNGNNESAFITTTSIGFIKHENLKIIGFEHAFKYQRTLYTVFDKINCSNCDYGIDCWQFSGTPPYSLNSNNNNGYYNNILSISNCQITNTIVGYRCAGACIYVTNCDSSNYTDTAFIFGGEDFNSGRTANNWSIIYRRW